MQRMAHSDGELATARGNGPSSKYLFYQITNTHFYIARTAAGKVNTIYTLSTLATSSIEEVSEAAPETNKFYQLYIYKDRELSKNLVRRAEKAGYKAIVLTVDAPVFGPRRRDIRNKFELPQHLR